MIDDLLIAVATFCGGLAVGLVTGDRLARSLTALAHDQLTQQIAGVRNEVARSNGELQAAIGRRECGLLTTMSTAEFAPPVPGKLLRTKRKDRK